MRWLNLSCGEGEGGGGEGEGGGERGRGRGGGGEGEGGRDSSFQRHFWIRKEHPQILYGYYLTIYSFK